MDSSLDLLTLSRFSEAVQSQFEVQTRSGTHVVMELSSVTPGNVARGGPDGSRFESFSLLFHGPHDPALPQGTYAFHHERLGNLDLFMVPIAKGKSGVDYQVIINRLVKES
jgi:hypothetical protein